MARESGGRDGSGAPRREQDSREKRIEELQRENAKLIHDLDRTTRDLVMSTLLRALSMAAVLMFPGFAWGQAGTVDVFTGGGALPLGGARLEKGSVTGGLTRWQSDRWGIGVSYAAIFGEKEAPLLHLVAPSIRWRRLDEPWSLEFGLRPVFMTNDREFSSFVVPVPTVDMFVGYRLLSSVRIQGGGVYYIDSFHPTLAIAWTSSQR